MFRKYKSQYLRSIKLINANLDKELKEEVDKLIEKAYNDLVKDEKNYILVIDEFSLENRIVTYTYNKLNKDRKLTIYNGFLIYQQLEIDEARVMNEQSFCSSVIYLATDKGRELFIL